MTSLVAGARAETEEEIAAVIEAAAAVASETEDSVTKETGRGTVLDTAIETTETGMETGTGIVAAALGRVVITATLIGVETDPRAARNRDVSALPIFYHSMMKERGN